MDLTFEVVVAGLKYGALAIAALSVFVSYMLRRQLVAVAFGSPSATAVPEPRFQALVDYFKHSDRVAIVVLVIAVLLQLSELGIKRFLPDPPAPVAEHVVGLRIEADERISTDLKPRFFQDNNPLIRGTAGVFMTKVRQQSSFTIDVNALRERIQDLIADATQRERQRLVQQVGSASAPLGPSEPGQ